MTPSGLAKVLVFPGVIAPVQGSPKSVLSKENPVAKASTVTSIDGQARVDRCFADTLGWKTNVVSVLKAGEGMISVIVETPLAHKIDPIIAMACPTVEICGREKLFTKCSVVDVKVRDGYLELLIEPSAAYILNWIEGAEHALLAVWMVKVHVGDRPAIELINQFNEIGEPLRRNSERSSR